MASPALPGLLLCFAATVLLIFACVSVPTWDAIYFLQAGGIRFGIFGFTGSRTQLGYNFDPTTLGFDGTKLNTAIIHNLTMVLILHPIAAGLAGLAVLFGLCGAGYHRAGTVIMTLLSGLAALVTLVVWVIDMVLFGIARSRFREQGIPAQYGNGNWLVLGALVALVLSFCASACGIFGSYHKRRGTY
ncbi:hypothetical protein E1B28_002664 [Marasmius oreades]|uniref:Pali-domain-containing protein n=1 Tax=Marasmius oreades TaxID=181124 RepID=A0A9P7UNB4_9AGAR|nr:uncharacterized protein E1B28_002664 [Marasmius oreades]KAG7086731.1 hypothetical protein E1B28_002664 [Marasmius oreades]